MLVMINHDEEVPSNTRKFHILMWYYNRQERFRQLLYVVNRRVFVLAVCWMMAGYVSS